MGNFNYDTLQIKVGVDSSEALSNVSKLTKGLLALEKTANNLDKNGLIQFKKLLQDIANIDFSNVTDGLKDVVSAFRQLNTEQKKASVIKPLPSKMESVAPINVLSKDSRIPDFSGLQKFAGFAPQLELAVQKFENLDLSNITKQGNEFTDILEKAGLSADQIRLVFNKMDKEDLKFSTDQIIALREGFIGLGYSATDVEEIISRIPKQVETANDKIKRFKDLFNNLGRRAIIHKILGLIYSITIKLINMMREGLKNFMQFDEEFAGMYNELKSSLKYLTNSLGNLIAPILKMIMPIISIITTFVGELLNSVGMLLNLLTGRGMIKAIKLQEDYAKELKKTTTIGIDELNIIGEQQKTYFVKVEGIEQLEAVSVMLSNISLLVGSIVLAFTTDWKAVKTVIKDVANEISTSFSSALKGATVDAKNLTIAFAGTITTVTSFINVMTRGIDWNSLITMIGGATVAVIGLQKAFHNLNVTASASAIGGLLMIISAFKDIHDNGITVQNTIMLVGGTVLGTVALCMTVLKDFVLFLYGSLAPAITAVAGAMGSLVAGVMLFVSAFDKVKASWGQANFWQKLAMVIGLVLVAVSSLVAVVSAFTHQWAIFAVGVAGMAVGAGLSIGVATNVPQFAEGGFPEDGLFMANHGELVGQFSNGRTAVANNEQITEGIYQAVRDAMRDSGNGNIVIEMDGYKVAQGVTKRQNNMDSIIKGGNLVYGK